jgi:hypothetical protein
MHSAAVTAEGEVFLFGLVLPPTSSSSATMRGGSATSSERAVVGLNHAANPDRAAAAGDVAAEADGGENNDDDADDRDDDGRGHDGTRQNRLAGLASGWNSMTAHERLREIVLDSERRYYSAGAGRVRPAPALFDDDGEREAAAEQEQEDDEGYTSSIRTRSVKTPVPRLCASLLGKTIVAVACGSSHTLAVEAGGRLYASGYNDSGQLGLGDRLNRAHFCAVHFDDGLRVVRVACGSAHNLAVVEGDAERDGPRDDGPRDGAATTSRSVWSWGNGRLGQLGIISQGDAGSGRNAHVPVQVESLPAEVKLVAAGSNHSVAVTSGDEVYAWGHNEFMQCAVPDPSVVRHARYYYLPRKLWVPAGFGPIVQAECGALFSVLVFEGGRVVSWGYGHQGSLGLEDLRVMWTSPRAIEARKFKGDPVTSVACGTTFVCCTTAPLGWPWALQMSALLEDDSPSAVALSDLEILWRGNPGPGNPGPGNRSGGGVSNPAAEDEVVTRQAHCFLLQARCPALWSLIESVLEDPSAASRHCVQRDGPLKVLSAGWSPRDTCKGRGRAGIGGAPPTDPQGVDHQRVLRVVLAGAPLASCRALVEYLYTDRVSVSAWRAAEMSRVANSLGLPHCAAQCVRCDSRTARSVARLSNRPSTFVDDMGLAFTSSLRADVTFLLRSEQGSGSGADAVEVGESGPMKPEIERIEAHKAILYRFGSYFGGLFGSDHFFREAAASAASTETSTNVMTVDLTHSDIPACVFRSLLLWCYTGDSSIICPESAIPLLIAAHRFGVNELQGLCENFLCKPLADGDIENDDIDILLRLSTMYDCPRLHSLCTTGRCAGGDGGDNGAGV